MSKQGGRTNARNAGKSVADPRTILGFFILGLVFLAVVAVNVGVRVSRAITGVPEEIPANPMQVLFMVAAGKLDFTTPAIVTSIAIAAIAASAAIIVALQRTAKPKPVVDTAAKHLASLSDIKSLSKDAAAAKAAKWLPAELAPDYPGLRMGKVPGTTTGLYSTWEDLYLVIFGPRMGKTTSQVIPAIVDAPGPVLTTSNKRDIIDETIGITGPRGTVYAFDPQRIAYGFEQEPWFYDPLDLVRREEATMDAAATELADIFKCASQGENSGGDAFFANQATDLLSRLFLAAAVDNRPITDVFKWVNDDSDRTPVRLLEQHGWSMQAEALQGQYNTTEKTRSGFFSQASQIAMPLGRREAARWITPTEGARKFDPDAFVRSAHDTLYILSKEGADNAAALTTALTAAVMKSAEAYGEANGGRLPVPLVAPLDEAANVVRWPQLPRLYSHYGSRSIILMTILQSYAQGVSVWGEEGMEALWSASAILLYGGGVRDEKMLQKMEALIGDFEEWTESVSISQGNRSVSRSTREKKILTVAELASLGDNRAVVFAAKRRPLIAQLEPFWERTYWSEDIKAALPGLK
ncbi:type IV secretory system conjugative DNA transfer family protein [Corynebacterium aquilae]|uniref:Conjugal transfer protein n=1 Tax=Corynebacterium aquilae DSM 44791 TaxID=1431546 RepID=A0A1L7CEI0_9CORY|nr:type IV secretory system conjugative DNA transfer family protein [Corynebacterium aquilae]APT84237.1 conjugal transfer protein [Corynebacterium aquilae DSM 44791]